MRFDPQVDHRRDGWILPRIRKPVKNHAFGHASRMRKPGRTKLAESYGGGERFLHRLCDPPLRKRPPKTQKSGKREQKQTHSSAEPLSPAREASCGPRFTHGRLACAAWKLVAANRRSIGAF